MPLDIFAMIAVIVVVSGATPVFTKISMQEIPPITFVLLRTIISSVLLFSYAVLRNQHRMKFTAIKDLLGVSLLGTANFLLFAFGIQHTTATASQILYACIPIITVVISFCVLHEKISAKSLFGVIVGFTGVLYIVIGPLLEQHDSAKNNILGSILIFCGAICWTFYAIFSKKIAHKHELSPVQLALGFLFIAMIAQLILLPFEHYQKPFILEDISWQAWLGLFYIGSIATPIFFILFQIVNQKSTSLVASIIYYLQPISVFIWAHLMIGEQLTQNLIIGAGVTLIGVWLVSKKQKNTDQQI